MSTEEEIIDFLDQINFITSPKFIEKWKHVYSVKFLKNFQNKVLLSLSERKPLKLKTLYTYMTKRCKYSGNQVKHFFKTIDIDLYYPFIFGSPSELP